MRTEQGTTYVRALPAAAFPRVLMCEPTHFDVAYAINPWMVGNRAQVDRVRAHAQWSALRDAISEFADVELMPAAPALPDLPFTANAGVLHDEVFVPSRFRFAERQGESPHFSAWFRDRGHDIRELPEGIAFEGAGDVLMQPDADFAWMGHGQRTDAAAGDALARSIELDVVPLELVDPRFYHLDTCFCPLPDGGAMYFETALSDASRRRVEARIPRSRRILVDEADACAFACNAVVLGRVIFTHSMPAPLRARLAHEGYDVRCLELDEFIRAGGSARCLTFQLPSIR